MDEISHQNMASNDTNNDMDALDLKILAQLQEDASLSNQALADRVHASPATTLRRVRRLREQGWIERIQAVLAPQALGPMLTGIVEVSLAEQNTEAWQRFEQLALQEPAVQQCYRVSPGPDFIVVLTVHDMPAYHRLADRLFTRHAGVRAVRTFFSVHRAKFSAHLPLPERG
jgi:Lrp/AsnC family leucine-responsive transcriptional regulator